MALHEPQTPSWKGGQLLSCFSLKSHVFLLSSSLPPPPPGPHLCAALSGGRTLDWTHTHPTCKTGNRSKLRGKGGS